VTPVETVSLFVPDVSMVVREADFRLQRSLREGGEKRNDAGRDSCGDLQ
jgi:hypothetical protein